ncbi:MAG: protein kinase [Planctomycetaceae bacterium]
MRQLPPEQITQLSQLLVQFDEALAECSAPSVVESFAAVAELSSDELKFEFQRGRDCLELLEQLRRRQLGDVGSQCGCSDTETEVAAGVSPGDMQDGLHSGLSLTGCELSESGSPRIGRFHLLRRIGSGGFGVVFLAEDPILQRLVALKVPRPETLSTRDLQQRFIRESQLAARLSHPHIVPIYDAGQADPVSYQVMAYCAGGNLATWLKNSQTPDGLPTGEVSVKGGDKQIPAHQKQLPVRVAARLVLALAEGLSYAHEHGILHRDLKPSNILLRPKFESGVKEETFDPGSISLSDLCDLFEPMIADFGLARLFDDHASDSPAGTHLQDHDCHETLLAGTPQYMAPEQIDGRFAELCPATDVYGLGAILYETLTGRPVLPRGSVEQLKNRVLHEPPAAMISSRPEISADLEAICLKCLAKCCCDRYQSAHELAADLRFYLNGEPVKARSQSWYESLRNWSRRRPAVASLLFLSGTLVAGLLCFSFWHVYRLNDLNGRLNTSVDELRLQTKAATEAGLRAERLARYAGTRNYATSMIRASELFRTNQRGRTGSYLQEFLTAEDDRTDLSLCGFEWRYLWNQTASHRELRGHNARILAAVMSSDGAQCYSIGKDETIRRWHAGSGQLIETWSIGPPATDYSARIEPGASRAIVNRTLSDSDVTEVVTWDLGAGEALHRRLLPDVGVLSLAIAPNGAWAAVGGRKNSENTPFLSFWDLSTGESQLVKLPLTEEHAFDGLNEISVTSDGTSVALCFQSSQSNGTFRHSIFVADLIWPSGSSQGQGIPEITSWRSVTELSGDLKTMAEFSPDGSLLAFSSSSPNQVIVWNVTEGHLVDELPDLRESVDSLAFNADGTTLALGISDSVIGSAPGRLSRSEGDSEPASDRLIFRDLKTGRTYETSFHGLQSLHSLACHEASGSWIIGEGGGRLSIWKPTVLPTHTTLPGHSPSEAWGLAFSNDSKTLYTVGDDRRLRSWDVATSAAGPSGESHTALVSCIATSDNGRWIATGGYDKQVVLWDARLMTTKSVLVGHQGDLRAVAFSPDGTKLASGGRDNQIRVWNVENGQLLTTLSRSGGAIRGLGFSSANDLIEASADGHLIRWRLDGSHTIVAGESEEIHSLQVMAIDPRFPAVIFSEQTAQTLAERISDFTPEVNVVYGCKGGNFRGLRIGNHLHRRWFDGSQPGADIRTVDVAPDGLTIAVAGDDKSVHLWHIESGQELLAFENLSAAVNQVRFSPNGELLAAALHDGTVRIWHAPLNR